MDFQKIIEHIAQAGENAIKTNESDYRINGILYCGKCHTAKQTTVTMLSKVYHPMVMCRCEQEKEEAEKRKIAEAERKERIERMREEAFDDYRMLQWTCENADEDVKGFVEMVKRYTDAFDEAKERGAGMMLYGGTGVGKSYIAACIVNRLIDKGIRCKMTTIAQIVNDIETTRGNRNDIIRDLNTYDLLVLDDVGAERDSDYMHGRMFEIINARELSGLPLIITTNLTKTDMANARDSTMKRIYSRIRGMCVPIRIDGEDRRVRDAETKRKFRGAT